VRLAAAAWRVTQATATDAAVRHRHDKKTLAERIGAEQEDFNQKPGVGNSLCSKHLFAGCGGPRAITWSAQDQRPRPSVVGWRIHKRLRR
jgi:hypothetical protein